MAEPPTGPPGAPPGPGARTGRPCLPSVLTLVLPSETGKIVRAKCG